MLNKDSRLLGLTVAFGIGCLSNVSAAESAPVPVVTPEMQTVINRYSVGKEAVESEGDALFKEGSRLLIDKKFDQARDSFIKAQRLFEQFSSEQFRDRVAACQRMIKQCYISKAQEAMRLADERVQARDFEEAVKLCEEAIKYCPEERAVLEEKISFYRKRQEAARTRDDVATDRLMPDRAREQYDIQVLLQQGRELADKGDFSKALRKFQEVLLIDPYNADALQNVLATNSKIEWIGTQRFAPTLRKMVSEVEWKFAIPITPDSDGVTGSDLLVDGPVKQVEKEESALQKKLDSIIIPRIDFEDVTVATAVKNLRDQSRLHDPERLGVNIFLRRSDNSAAAQTNAAGTEPGMPPGMPPNPGAPAPDAGQGNTVPSEERRITLGGTNRSLMDVIVHLCKRANMRYRVEKYAVILAPQDVALDEMETQIFPVEQSALASIPGGGDDRAALRKFFVENGVDFPIGSKIVYDTRISRLIVTNTVENLRAISKVISEVLDQQEPMVQVMVKFIEISQSDLKELAFNYQVAINTNATPGGHTVVMPANSNELMRYYRDTSGDSVPTARDPVAESTFSYIWENSDGTRVTGSMFALNWADSADVLASPRVTTLPGQTAHIEMVTERFFPEDWETVDLKASDSSSSSSSGGSNTTSSSWITTRADPQPKFESEPRKLGIVFDITPEVDRERRTITAPVVFPIQTFSGWMVFDARTQNSDGSSDSGDSEYFKMPIFDRREINTMITVYDGDTVVLGGVAADTTSSILDKIPVLGDLPFVGRFFQSRYSHAEKSNLLVFLTCKLVKPDGTPFFPQEERPRGVPRFGQNYY